MAAKTKKKKYKKINFKLSEKQFSILNSFCKSKKTTPNKIFKKAIKDYIVNNYDFNDVDYHISENQLALFDLDEDAQEDAQDNANEPFNNETKSN